MPVTAYCFILVVLDNFPMSSDDSDESIFQALSKGLRARVESRRRGAARRRIGQVSGFEHLEDTRQKGEIESVIAHERIPYGPFFSIHCSRFPRCSIGITSFDYT